MTVTAPDDIGAAFEAALAQDAGSAEPPQAPPPPRRPERDPEAPHGRDGDGTPLAPYGTKRDGTPRIKPPGPGRPRDEEKPRVTASAPPAAGGGKAEARDYSADLAGLATTGWLALSSIRGGKFGPVTLPDTRPYAAVLHQQTPALVAAWNAAAQQNAAVRGWVEKFSGDGSMTWIVGVAVSGVQLIAGCVELARAAPEVRAAAAETNDKRLGEFAAAQVKAMGMEA